MKILTQQFVILLTYHTSNISDIYSLTTVNVAEISTVKFYTSPFQPLRLLITPPSLPPYDPLTGILGFRFGASAEVT